MNSSCRPWLKYLFFGVLNLAALWLSYETFKLPYLAFQFPLEVEVRESYSWLYVLAMKHGINIYDHSKLAFGSMGHGPMDPILKYFIARALPFLKGAQVSRIFVALIPPALIGFCLPFATAGWLFFVFPLVLASFIFISLSSLTHFFPMVGRSDPAAVFFFIVLIAFASRHQSRKLWHWFTLGFLTGIVFLINWRYTPFPVLVSLFSAAHAKDKPWRTHGAWNVLGVYLAGAVIPWIVILGTLFHWDLNAYWHYFFGLFFLGTNTIRERCTWNYFMGVTEPVRYALGAFVIIISINLGLIQQSSRLKLPRALLCLFLAFLLCSVIFVLNWQGGGIYYYGTVYLMAWMFIVRFPPPLFWQKAVIVGLVGIVVLMRFDLHESPRQARQLEAMYPRARSFLHILRGLNEHYGVHSEALHLYEDHYQGELIDMGDMARYLNYGPLLKKVEDRYFEWLKTTPPHFVYAAFTESAEMKQKLREGYVKIAESPPCLIPNGYQTMAIYELRRPGSEW